MLFRIVRRFERNNYVNHPVMEVALPQLKFGDDDRGGIRVV